jgi:hypothetical protein
VKLPRGQRGRCIALGTVFASLMGQASIPAARGDGPPGGVEAELPESSGARLVFHGWSPDSQWIAYSRFHPPSPRDAEASAREQRMHRRVRDGRFDGFGKMVGGDVAAFAAERAYRAEPLPRRVEGPRRFVFGAGAVELTLTIEVGRGLGFSLADGGRVIYRHTFDRLYVRFDPELYPSPDGQQALLVFHLDSGWDIDAAVFPLRLRASIPAARTKKDKARR